MGTYQISYIFHQNNTYLDKLKSNMLTEIIMFKSIANNPQASNLIFNRRICFLKYPTYAGIRYFWFE